ncbi:MAG: hypothetical protein KDB27_16500, partial [Planctomycetales bacterium]|nr:hypothetical protein [Planctomycetales bacterium]
MTFVETNDRRTIVRSHLQIVAATLERLSKEGWDLPVVCDLECKFESDNAANGEALSKRLERDYGYETSVDSEGDL